jgi:hypothetical protein
MIIISVCQVSQCREVLVGWLVVSFTLTFHLQRYTGYHNYRYLCMSIYRVPFHADVLSEVLVLLCMSNILFVGITLVRFTLTTCGCHCSLQEAHCASISR